MRPPALLVAAFVVLIAFASSTQDADDEWTETDHDSLGLIGEDPPPAPAADDPGGLMVGEHQPYKLITSGNKYNFILNELNRIGCVARPCLFFRTLRPRMTLISLSTPTESSAIALPSPSSRYAPESTPPR